MSDNPYTKAPPLPADKATGRKDPLYGFIPKKVTLKQVLSAMVGDMYASSVIL